MTISCLLETAAPSMDVVNRHYAIVCEADLSEELSVLAVREDSLRGILQARRSPTDVSHSSATVPAEKAQIARENLAEGARFELADPLRGLRFSRPARSATPSPLQAVCVLNRQSVPHAIR